MNPLIDNPGIRQQAREWSSQLGALAAEKAIAPAFPTRLTTILAHLRQRNQRRQQARDQLRANEFIIGQ